MTSTIPLAYVGIDVACAKKKRLPVCLATWENGRLVPFPIRDIRPVPPRGRGNVATLDPAILRDFAAETAQYLLDASSALGVQIARIGIDAPSAPAPEGRRRAAERALDSAGISCFATPSRNQFREIHVKVSEHLSRGGAESRLPHANQLWMLVGFALFDRLETLAPCVEVFPQATARAMGSGLIHKFRKGGAEAQLDAAAFQTGWPATSGERRSLKRISWGGLHDQVDAYLAAWVAALEEEERRGYGDPPHDVIWVPRMAPTQRVGSNCAATG